MFTKKSKTPFLRLAGVLICVLLLTPFTSRAIDLLKAYEFALRNNPRHLAQLYDLEASKAYKWEGLSYLLPHISFSYSKARYDFILAPEYYKNYTSEYYAFNFSQPIFNYGYYARYKAMKTKGKMSEYSYKDEENDLRFRVSIAYFNALDAYGSVILAEKEKDIARKNLDIATKMLKAGAASKDDVALANSRYDVSLSNLIEAQSEYKAQLSTLESIIGKAVNKLVKLKNDVDFDFPIKTLQYWIDKAKADNPKLKYYRENERYYKYNLKQKIGEQLPSVSFFTTYAHTNSNNYIGTRKTTYKVFGIQINVPLFDGGNTVASIDEAEYRVKEAIENTRDQERQIINKIKEAYFGVSGDKLKIASLKRAVESAKVALEGAYKGLKAGTKTVKDVIDNEKNLYEVQKMLLDAKFDFLKNWIALKKYAGALTDNDIVEINAKYLQHGWFLAEDKGGIGICLKKTYSLY